MALLATQEEEAIIKKRYLTLTAVTSTSAVPPFKKLTKRYFEFCQAIEKGTAEDAERIYGELLTDLYAVQFHMQKLGESSTAFQREQQMYREGQEQLQASIVKAAADIEERKRQLEEARVELRNKQEYEVLKRQVVAVPARSATRAEMEAVQREITDLVQQAQQLDALFDRRKQQFSAIAGCIEEVHATVESESPEEGEAAVGEGPPAAGAGGAEQVPPAPPSQPLRGRPEGGSGRGGAVPMQIG